MAKKKKKQTGLMAGIKDNAMLICVLLFGSVFLYLLFTGGGKPSGSEQQTDSPYVSAETQAVSLQSAKLLYVVDGDTLCCYFNDMEVYVRLIGVDTAESVNPDNEKNNEYGEMASDYTSNLLKGYDTVYLEFGESMSDKYGRLLAYVWLNPDVTLSTTDNMASYMLNYILLDKGYAYDMPVAPNLKYADAFEEVCNDAKTTNTGLWAYKTYRSLYSTK